MDTLLWGRRGAQSHLYSQVSSSNCRLQSSRGLVLLLLREAVLGQGAGGKRQFSYLRKLQNCHRARQSRRNRLFHFLPFLFPIFALKLPWLFDPKWSREMLAGKAPSPRVLPSEYPWTVPEISPLPCPRNYLEPDSSLGPDRNLRSNCRIYECKT